MAHDSDQLSELEGSAFDLGELLAYQSGAIVSRTLLDTRAATITVFALDENQRISEHTAPHTAMLQVLDGTGSVTINDDKHVLETGEAIVMPANEPHAVDAPSRFKMLLTMVR